MSCSQPAAEQLFISQRMNFLHRQISWKFAYLRVCKWNVTNENNKRQLTIAEIKMFKSIWKLYWGGQRKLQTAAKASLTWGFWSEVNRADILQFHQFWLVHPFEASLNSLPEGFPGCLEQERQKLQIGGLKPGGRMEHGSMSSRWGNRKWQTARRSWAVIYDRVKQPRGRRGEV